MNLTPTGPPETRLSDEPAPAVEALAAAKQADEGRRRDEVSQVVARWPACIAAWATLGDLGRDPIERYAAYRVGYHRGLDRLRREGWRGSGYVRWEHPGNRGFLRCVHGLEQAAATIGEDDERERCAQFLRQLDPAWPPPDLR